MADQKNLITVEISHRTVIFTVLLLINLWLVIQIRQIIVLLFLSLILLSGLLRPVGWLQSKKIPRALSVLIVYVFIIIFIAFTIGIILPPLISQTSEFFSKLPQILGTINDFLIFNKIPLNNTSDIISKQVQSIAGNLISVSTTIFSSIFLVITLLVFTFYLLLEWNRFVRFLTSPFSGKNEKKITNLISNIESGLGGWLRGQLSLSLIIGLFTYIGLRLLGIPFALPLALVAGILEVVPIIGPIISAIPAVLVGLTVAPIMGLAVTALFFVIQQLESHFIVPMVMKKVAGLQPPVVIIALLVGSKLGGIGGAFLAIPIIVVGKAIFSEFFHEDQKISEELEEI